VLALVQTRLDAEDPIARRVLRAASIFGREAPPAGIAHLLGEGFDETSVRETLRGLAEREVLEASGPEGADFVFRHDLVREAAYATLTDGDRSLGHGLAGDWLESNGARDAAVMAAHFDRGGDRARAARWYARAAVQLLEGNDLATAEKHATRSLELAVDTDESVRGHALLVLAQVRRWIGDTASVVELAFDAADRLAPGTLDWFSALQAATSVADTTGRRDVAERVLDRVLAAQPTNAAAAGARVVTMATVASSRLHDGDDVGAKELMERVAAESVELAERDPIVLAYVHRASATRAGNQGDFAAELAGWRAAAEAFGRGGERRLVVVARCNEGYGWLALGAYEQAERTLRDALAEAESMDLQHVAAAARHNLGLALAHLGKVEEGLREETNAIDVLVRTGDHRLASNALSYRATIRALAGDLEGAEDDARKAVVDTAFTTRGLALAVLSDVLLARGKVDEALSIAAEGMDISKSGTLEGGTSAVRLAWANALFAVGRVEEAHAAIDDAIRDLYERAARIEDEAMRGQFLRDEVTHAKILKRADEWDVTTRT
jgi:tetratricopeptide (TPR) repeat protein